MYVNDSKQKSHYFEKRTNEEDMPVYIEEDMQDKFENLEILYEDFFDENSLSTAKVKLEY